MTAAKCMVWQKGTGWQPPKRLFPPKSSAPGLSPKNLSLALTRLGALPGGGLGLKHQLPGEQVKALVLLSLSLVVPAAAGAGPQRVGRAGFVRTLLGSKHWRGSQIIKEQTPAQRLES